MIVGIDEAGRGCWAGPLVAAAVLLDQPITGLTDSKQLTAARRVLLDAQIRQQALAMGIGWVHPEEIDEIGLTAATTKAMTDALSQIQTTYSGVIIDGNYNYLPAVTNVQTMVKADILIPSVSAASIIAKVARDNYMIEAAKKFPAYQFEKHVGYGTMLHRQMLETNGICELHRRSYKPIQKLLNNVK